MYKTAMRVMMIGLVALLGAEAEAHYVVIKGRCVWHSGECVRQDEDVPKPPIPINDIPISEIVARPKSVEILCPGGPHGIVKQIDLTNDGVTLAARKRIDPSDITERRDPVNNSNMSTNLEVQGIISDAIFLEDPALPRDSGDFDFCSGLVPLDMIIRSMSVEMNLYLNSDPTKSHSTWKAGTCTLSDTFNLKNYPKNVPPRGAPFDCSGTFGCHEGVCEEL